MGSKVHLVEKVTCPFCWSKFKPEEVLWVSESDESILDPMLDGLYDKLRFLPSRFDARGNALDEFGVPCHDIACPSCHLTLPRDVLEARSYLISVVGTPFSGKSYFLASMVSCLRDRFPDVNILFKDSDVRFNEMIIGYEKTQFRSSDPDSLALLQKTQKSDFGGLYKQVLHQDTLRTYPSPFFFTMQPIGGGQSSVVDNQPFVLTLYDNAGESFDAGEDKISNQVTRHLGKSDTIYFLFDVTQERSLRLACQEISDDPQVTHGIRDDRQELTLNTMIETVRKHSGLARSEKCKRPIVVVVTKADIWLPLINDNNVEAELPQPLKISEDGSALMDLSIIEEVSRKTRALLVKHCKGMIALMESFSDDVTYIPVSATGVSPEMDEDRLGIRPSDIKSRWVEIPFLYSLAKDADYQPINLV